MTEVDLVRQFKEKVEYEPSTLTLTGTGLNGAAQVEVLCEIGVEALERLSKINVVSGSAFSYFILHAYYSAGLRINQFGDFDRLNRKLHGSGVTRALGRLGPVVLKKRAFFQNHLLGETGKNLFTDDFCQRTLRSFPANLSFWSYCQADNEIIEISDHKGFGDMTVTELIRATASASFLHGDFEFGHHRFIDPNFSPKASNLKKYFFSIRENHLLVNFKRNASRGKTILVKQDRSAYPSVSLMRDFLFFTLGVPNRSIKNTHIRTLALLGK